MPPVPRFWTQSRKAATAASLTYALLLAASGIYMPFFPLWLKDRGFDAQAIALLTAIPMLMRITSAPLAKIGDGALGPRRTFVLMACASAFSYIALAFTHDFLGLAIILAIGFTFVSATTPLLDAIVLNGVSLHGHNYGRIRQWGSVSWLLTGLTVGLLLEHLPRSTIPAMMAFTAALTVFAGLWLPDDRREQRPGPVESGADKGTSPGLALLVLFSAGVACIQGAHAFLYGFATLIWSGQGFSSFQISQLWAVGVVVEICIFLFASIFSARLGPFTIIIIGGVAGMARWGLFSLTPTSGSMIAALQAMHGISFAWVHFATMSWLSRFTDNPSWLQGVVASAIGLGLTLCTLLSGQLYEPSGHRGYFVMALITGLGIILMVCAAVINKRRSSAIMHRS